MPVRSEFFFTGRQEARKQLGLDDRPLVVSFWGSLGAREMNKMIARFMARNAQDNQPFQHIHSTGSYGWKWMPDYVKEQGVDLEHTPAIDMREFIYDMPTVMAAADLVICRARCGDHCRGGGGGKACDFRTVPQCHRQPSGEERPDH